MWTVSNGQTASGETASLTFDQAGTYTIELTVTDDGGAIDTYQRFVTVTATEPEPPSTEPSAKKTSNCTAIYYLDGHLYLPCVQVDGEPAVTYDVEMTLSSPKPMSFSVIQVKTVEEAE